MSSHCKRSKHCKARLLATKPMLRPYLPQTRPLTLHHLENMLRMYKQVYLKPDVGSTGYGIYRIQILEHDNYHLRGQDGTCHKGNLEEIKREVRKISRTCPYIIQQGIHSVTRHGRPFDLRIHVQKVGTKWVIGGIVGKVALPHSIVTNRQRGAHPTPIKQILSHHLKKSPLQQRQLLEKMKSVAIHGAYCLDKSLTTPREYGFDIGIDQKNFWIYEVNTRPLTAVFSHLSDPNPYRQILRNRKKTPRRLIPSPCPPSPLPVCIYCGGDAI